MTPETHRCELPDLDYQYNGTRLYRVVCTVCSRTWRLTLVPDRYKEGKLVGFWSCSHLPPRNAFTMREWWDITNNSFEPVEYPADIKLREENKQRRMMKENDPYLIFGEWKKKGGHLPKMILTKSNADNT